MVKSNLSVICSDFESIKQTWLHSVKKVFLSFTKNTSLWNSFVLLFLLRDIGYSFVTSLNKEIGNKFLPTNLIEFSFFMKLMGMGVFGSIVPFNSA